MLSANKTSSPLSLKEKNSSKEEIEIGDDEDGSWEDWEGGSEEPCLCPVCPCTDATPARIFRHCVETHSLDLHEIVSEIASNKQIVARGLEEEEMARIYTGMKLVNYLRRIGGGGGGTSTTTSITQAGIIAAASIWAHSEEFLKPVLESDAMLYGEF